MLPPEQGSSRFNFMEGVSGRVFYNNIAPAIVGNDFKSFKAQVVSV